MNRDQLLINDSGWRPPEGVFNNGIIDQHPYEVQVPLPRRSNKIESRKKLSVGPYDVANKKIKKERSSKGKCIPSIEELGIELREEEDIEEEEEEYDEDEVKKINEDFVKSHVVYGKEEAIKSILNKYKELEGIQGVISSNVVDEICISRKKLYDVNKNFKRGDLLGTGGVGTVHLVTDCVSKKEFVQKTIKKENFARKEVELLLHLQHKNITEFYGLIVDDDYISVFMSFAGTNLEMLVLRDKLIFTEDEVIYFSIQALSALAYMHQYSMIHMDIKPQNICIKRDTTHLSLTDFGSSLTTQQPLNFAGVTPEYMSPELCQLFVNKVLDQQKRQPGYDINRRKLNGKNDVYAWACTMCFVFLQDHAALKYINPKMNRFQFLYLVASSPNLMSTCIPDTIQADLKNIIGMLLNGAVQNRPNAESGKHLLKEIQKNRFISRKQMYQPLESRDDKHASIKLKLKEKIKSNMCGDDPEPSTTSKTETKLSAVKAEDEAPNATQNIPNFDSLF